MEIPIHGKIFIILRRNPFYQWLFQEYFEENMSKFVISIVTSDVEISLTARIFILLYLYYYIHTVMTVQHVKGLRVHCGKNRMATILQVTFWDTVETLYSTIHYSKYFIELNFDKSAQYVALWTHKRHPIPRPFGRAMECLLWVLQQKLTVL